ncbi:glycosyltransferase family 4 protein [Flavobacterium praedii]|uniref:glycosyltransferase family 4 protein n=1 Tax=Flavobacterium praedii TaxID=3002900 RepID=UPI002481DE3E|nr:glycosyltransferase family 4 protein [Flavobacterium praedii]
MKLLLITQVFYPDTVSVSQHLWDLAEHLQNNGHEISVFTSKYPYEEKNTKYSDFEVINGIKIYRISQSKLGKGNPFFRIIDFFTFSFNIGIKLLFVKKNKYDVILGTTVPPLLSFLGVVISKFNKIPFYYWVMDLQPELSIASHLIKKDSLAAKFFTTIGNYSIKESKKIISLDKFMTEYLIGRGAEKKDVFTIPVWPVIDKIYEGKRNENPFRIENDFGDKIVIMYSGNHAYVHPLDTLLNVTKLLENDNRFLFVFVGGGVRKKDVSDFKFNNKLENIIQLPFQPRENIHNSLGASDVQVVIMGNNQVGFTHPNKIYGAMFVGKPILYIGPKQSHVTEIISDLDGNIMADHNDENTIVNGLLEFANLNDTQKEEIGLNNLKYVNDNFSPTILKNKMLEAIVNLFKL